MAAAVPMLAFDRVIVRRGDTPVLADVTLTISRGSFVALVGPSGAGKTTLLRTVNRMIVPAWGQVRLNGTDIAALDPVQLRRGIGYAVQGAALFPHWTVAENIAAVPRLLGHDRSLASRRVAALLDLVELPASLAGRLPTTLSGGQASRVGLARALAGAPPLLLLDEPFGALDPETRAALGERLLALHRDQALTTLLVTHDVGDALLRADRIIVLGEGRVAADGPPAAIARSDIPEVRALLASPLAQARALAAL